MCLYARVPVAYAVTAPLPSCRMSEQLTNTNLAAHLKTQGRWGGDPACRGNGVAAARPCSPSVRSPSVRPAASAALEANIKTLQAEIVKLGTIERPPSLADASASAERSGAERARDITAAVAALLADLAD